MRPADGSQRTGRSRAVVFTRVLSGGSVVLVTVALLSAARLWGQSAVEDLAKDLGVVDAGRPEILDVSGHAVIVRWVDHAVFSGAMPPSARLHGEERDGLWLSILQTAEPLGEPLSGYFIRCPSLPGGRQPEGWGLLAMGPGGDWVEVGYHTTSFVPSQARGEFPSDLGLLADNLQLRSPDTDSTRLARVRDFVTHEPARQSVNISRFTPGRPDIRYVFESDSWYEWLDLSEDGNGRLRPVAHGRSFRSDTERLRVQLDTWSDTTVRANEGGGGEVAALSFDAEMAETGLRLLSVAATVWTPADAISTGPRRTLVAPFGSINPSLDLLNAEGLCGDGQAAIDLWAGAQSGDIAFADVEVAIPGATSPSGTDALVTPGESGNLTDWALAAVGNRPGVSERNSVLLGVRKWDCGEAAVLDQFCLDRGSLASSEEVNPAPGSPRRPAKVSLDSTVVRRDEAWWVDWNTLESEAIVVPAEDAEMIREPLATALCVFQRNWASLAATEDATWEALGTHRSDGQELNWFRTGRGFAIGVDGTRDGNAGTGCAERLIDGEPGRMSWRVRRYTASDAGEWRIRELDVTWRAYETGEVRHWRVYADIMPCEEDAAHPALYMRKGTTGALDVDLLLASIAEALGLEPSVDLVSGHAALAPIVAERIASCPVSDVWSEPGDGPLRRQQAHRIESQPAT